MRIVRPDVRLVRLLSRQIEEVVLTNQLFELQHREFQCYASLTAEALTSSQQFLKTQFLVAENTLCIRFKDQPINAVYHNNCLYHQSHRHEEA